MYEMTDEDRERGEARMMGRNAFAIGADVVESFELVQPTPEELRKLAQVAKRVQREEAPTVLANVPPPSLFRLTGSDRPADQDPNQISLF